MTSTGDFISAGGASDRVQTAKTATSREEYRTGISGKGWGSVRIGTRELACRQHADRPPPRRTSFTYPYVISERSQELCPLHEIASKSLEGSACAIPVLFAIRPNRRELQRIVKCCRVFPARLFTSAGESLAVVSLRADNMRQKQRHW